MRNTEGSSPDRYRKLTSRIKYGMLTGYGFMLLVALFSSAEVFFAWIFTIAALACFAFAYSAWDERKRLGRKSDDKSYRQQHYSSITPKRYHPENEGGTSSTRRRKSFGEAIRSMPIHVKIVAGFWILLVFIFIFVIPQLDFSFSRDDFSFLTDAQAEFYNQAGNDFYEQGQYDSAYNNFKKALAIKNDYTAALFGYGNTLYTRNYPDSSIYYYDKVLELDPTFHNATYNKAWVYFMTGKFDQSLEVLNQLPDEDSTYYTARQLMGDNYYEKNQREEAFNWYENAYAKGVRSSEFCYRLGYLHDNRNNRDRAIELYKESIEYDTLLGGAYRRLGELLPGEEGNFYRARAAQIGQTEN